METQQTLTDTPLLKGTISVRKIVYTDLKSSFRILKAVAPDGKNPTKELSYQGNFDQATVGACYEVEGTMEKSTKKGYENTWFFKVKKSSLVEGETSAEGMQKYLCREGPNLGDIRAKQLTDAFGMKVIQVLANTPQEVAGKIKDLTPERLQQLHLWAKDELVLSAVKRKLYEWKLTPALISKILVTYGRNTAEVLKKDPYRITEIKGIGFKTASTVGDAVGCSPTDKRRLQAGLLYLLEEELQQGNICLPYDLLLRKGQELLGVGRDLLIAVAKELVAENKLATQHSEPHHFCKNKELLAEQHQLSTGN